MSFNGVVKLLKICGHEKRDYYRKEKQSVGTRASYCTYLIAFIWMIRWVSVAEWMCKEQGKLNLLPVAAVKDSVNRSCALGAYSYCIITLLALSKIVFPAALLSTIVLWWRLRTCFLIIASVWQGCLEQVVCRQCWQTCIPMQQCLTGAPYDLLTQSSKGKVLCCLVYDVSCIEYVLLDIIKLFLVTFSTFTATDCS